MPHKLIVKNHAITKALIFTMSGPSAHNRNASWSSLSGDIQALFNELTANHEANRHIPITSYLSHFKSGDHEAHYMLHFTPEYQTLDLEDRYPTDWRHKAMKEFLVRVGKKPGEDHKFILHSIRLCRVRECDPRCIIT